MEVRLESPLADPDEEGRPASLLAPGLDQGREVRVYGGASLPEALVETTGSSFFRIDAIPCDGNADEVAVQAAQGLKTLYVTHDIRSLSSPPAHLWLAGDLNCSEPVT